MEADSTPTQSDPGKWLCNTLLLAAASALWAVGTSSDHDIRCPWCVCTVVGDVSVKRPTAFIQVTAVAQPAGHNYDGFVGEHERAESQNCLGLC